MGKFNIYTKEFEMKKVEPLSLSRLALNFQKGLTTVRYLKRNLWWGQSDQRSVQVYDLCPIVSMPHTFLQILESDPTVQNPPKTSLQGRDT